MVELNGVELTEHESELYDRQIRVWGLESQKRLRASKILISGINGLGAEIAKNIILAGVKSVVLNDVKTVTKSDNFSQFLVPTTDLDKNRAEASLQRARVLNPSVEITSDTELLKNKTEEFFCSFDVVVLIEAETEEICRVNELCRKNNIKFFCGDVWGMFGYGFIDLNNHDFVEEIFKHKVVSKDNGKEKTEMISTTVKRNLQFTNFEKVLNFDYNSVEYQKKMKRFGPWFIILRILQVFRNKYNRDPNYLTRDNDIVEILKIRDELTTSTLIPDNLFTHVFNQISPVAAIVGGEIAQEIIKSVSQKEAPHKNLFLFDPNNCCGFIETIE